MRLETKTPMTLEHFHDFYFLEALKAGMARHIAAQPEQRFRRAVEKLTEDIDIALEEISENMAFRVFVYLYAACFGEARHAREAQAKERYLPDTKKMGRTECYVQSLEYNPTRENINALVGVFNQDWHSGFGGKAWKTIAEALHLYFDASPTSFLDYVIDLEHNGGCVFNKSDAYTAIHFSPHYPEEFKTFLNFKFYSDILTDYPGWTMNVTRRVYSLVERYTVIFRQKMPKIRARLATLTDYQVNWGSKKFSLVDKWYQWVDVTKGNEPSPEILWSLTGIDDLSPGGFTVKELTKLVKKTVKNVKKLAKPHMTKVLSKKLDERVEQWLQWALPRTKIVKNAVTYEVLPVKVKTEKGITLQVPFEYTGLGKKTDYGFEVTLKQASYPTKGKDNGFDGTPGWANGHITLVYGEIHLNYGALKLNIDCKQLEAYLV